MASRGYGSSSVRWTKESAFATDLALQEAQRWIEKVTGEKFSGSTFKSSLNDGVLLCELMNKIQPGIVKKTHRTSGTIFHMENVTFFLEACKKLGLKGSQIFDITDISDVERETAGFGGALRGGQERTSRNIYITIYWLGRKAKRVEGYKGPQLDESKFKKIISSWVGKAREEKRSDVQDPDINVTDNSMEPEEEDTYGLPRDSESSEDNKEEEGEESDKEEEEEAVEEEKAPSPALDEDDLVREAPVQVVSQSVEETNEDDLVFEAPVQVVTQSVEEMNEDDLVREAFVQVATQSVEETNVIDLVFEAPVNVQVVTQSVEERPQLDPLTHPEDVVKIEAKKKVVIEIEFEFSVKAQFSYSPEDDPHIPRVDLGKSFNVGDILHVIDQRDPNWWKVVKETKIRQYPGLVPSRRLQESLAAMKQKAVAGDAEQKHMKKKKKFRLKKKRKHFYHVTVERSAQGVDDLLSYEEVVKVNPDPNYRRPIFVIGFAGIDERAIVKKLTDYSSRFVSPVPDTSRRREPNEQNGIDYNFIDRNTFQKGVSQNLYVQAGTHNGNWFGTRIQAIRDIGLSGKVAVVPVYYQALKPLRMADLKPYIVYLKPKGNLTTRNPYGTSSYGQKGEPDMMEEAKRIEAYYAHYFDLTLVVEDIQRAAEELVKVADHIQNEPQWVYANWVK